MKQKVKIELREWDFDCGDGCCNNYGTEIIVDGKLCDNQYTGSDVAASLRFALETLGYDVEIEETFDTSERGK